MATGNLNLLQPAPAAVDKVVDYNTNMDDIDGCLGTVLTQALTNSDVTLTEIQTKRVAVLLLTGTLSANVAVKLDDDIDHALTVISQVDNAGYTLTLQQVTATGAGFHGDVLLEENDVRYIFKSDTGEEGIVCVGSGNFYVPVSDIRVATVYGSDEVVHRQLMGYRGRFPANLGGSYASLEAAATAQTDFDVRVGGSSIGTIRFAISGTVGTFVGNFTTDSDFNHGADLDILAPNSADATAAGLTVCLKGMMR